MKCHSTIFLFGVGFAGLLASGEFAALADKPEHQYVTLSGAVELTESSGMAFSTRDANCIWTHNDSPEAGAREEPVLFCFDSRTGVLTGRCELESATATDWESLTNGRVLRNELIVADCGDNLARRKFITLYRFPEPDPHQRVTLRPSDYEKLEVRFPTGPVDCEAIWYDVDAARIVLLAKGRLPIAGVYVVSDDQWQDATANPQDADDGESARAPVNARQIATIALPMATGADRDPSTGDLWIASYFQAFCFRRGEHESLEAQIKQIPTSYEMPPLRQIEAIAIDQNSRVWVTSEGTPPVLVRCRFD